MNKTCFLSALFALVFCAQLFATDITWLKLNGDFTYEDVTTSCSNSPLGNNVYFVAEIENDQPVKASIRRYANSSSEKFSVDLTESELKSIVFFKDPNGYYWLKEMALSSETMA